MDQKFLYKLIRLFIAALVFLSLTNIIGMKTREAHQFLFMLSLFIIFGLLLRNIWLTMFLWWTVFLFTYYKFQCGNVYLANVFYGCILYYATKVAYKKKHIDFFIKIFLSFVGINLVYMVLQALNFDFIYKTALNTTEGFKGFLEQTEPAGFMGCLAVMGVLMALSVPILASRTHKYAIPISLLMFVPLYISRSTICVLGGVAGLFFVLFFKMKFRYWILSLLGLLSLAVLYIVYIDAPMGTLTNRLYQWKIVLRDCIIHPVVGWGLDTFRSFTAQKQHLYAMGGQVTNKITHYDLWDNPHNLYISLFFEWGILGLIFLGGYLRQCCLWFKKAIKEPNTLGLAGFVLVTLIVSIAQFPVFLAKTAVVIVPMFALYEVQVK